MHHFQLRSSLIIILLFGAIGYLYADRLDVGLEKNIPTEIDSNFSYVSDLTFWRRTVHEQSLKTNFRFDLEHDLTQTPLKLENWEGKETQTDVGVLVMLEPEQYVERIYTNDQQDSVWLHLVGGRQSKTFHPPEICYDSAGWDTSANRGSLTLSNGQNLSGVLIDATRTQGYQVRQLSFYFYLFSQVSRSQNDGVTMVRVTTNFVGDIDSTLSILSAFVSNLFFSTNQANFQSNDLSIQPLDIHANAVHLTGVSIFESQQLDQTQSPISVNLNWKAIDPNEDPYYVQLFLTNEDGIVWSEVTNALLLLYEAELYQPAWLTGEIVQGEFQIHPYHGIPPGSYKVNLSISQPPNDSHIYQYDSSNTVIGIEAEIGEININHSTVTIGVEPQNLADIYFNELGLRLTGFSMDKSSVQVGDEVLFTMFWFVEHDSDNNLLPLKLLSETEEHIQIISPIASNYDLKQLDENTAVLGQIKLKVPPELVGGDYSVLLDDQLLGRIEVKEPQRLLFSPLESNLAVKFENGIELAGLEITTHDTLTLVWQTERIVNNRYHIFVHALDESNVIITQSDSEPGNWTRPTTSWLPNEFILDEHHLGFDTFETLRIGIYDPLNGEQVPLASGEPFFITKSP